MSKGLAYIEYADEVTAAKALVKTDGTFLHGRRLSVAVSNPPPRRTGGEFGHPSVAGLGQQSGITLYYHIHTPYMLQVFNLGRGLAARKF